MLVILMFAIFLPGSGLANGISFKNRVSFVAILGHKALALNTEWGLLENTLTCDVIA